MPDATIVRHEDSCRLTQGMGGKLSIEVHAYRDGEAEAVDKAFEMLTYAKQQAIAKGYISF